MQDTPLAIPHIFDRAEKYFGRKEIATATSGGIERINYADWAARTRALGGVLDDLGISADGRVATLSLTLEEMQRGDPEAAVNNGLLIKGVEVAALFKWLDRAKTYREKYNRGARIINIKTGEVL